MEAALAEQGGGHELVFFDVPLNAQTAGLVEGFAAACLVVGDQGNRAALTRLKEVGVQVLVLRSAGFNHVDLEAARDLGLTVLRVPAYSPHAVAEHAVALLMALNRKIHRAYNRVREHNFAIEGLIGFDLYGKTAGVIGVGTIGACFARIMVGFGCRVLAFDPVPNAELEALGVVYTDLETLLRESDVVSLHCPLTPGTRHLVDGEALALMKPTAVLVNTSRGAVVDSQALLTALKRGQLAGVALDVYEEEEGLFFKDLSEMPLQDDLLARLLTFPNVLLTAHQAFLTHEALGNIAGTTIQNLTDFERGAVNPANVVGADRIRG